ncbi:MAG: MFS transporter, partial [Caulobacterales bacterium]
MTSSAPTDASAASEWRNSKKLVLTAAMGVGLSAAPTYSLGVFIGPLMAEYKWSLGDIVFAQSVMSIIVALTAPLAGILVDKVGVRPLALLGALIISASMAGFAFINGSLVAYYACWVLVALGTTLASVVIWLAPIVSHFSRTRGLAVSITLCGSNLAGAIAPMLAVSLINTSGWQAAYLGLGAYLFVST